MRAGHVHEGHSHESGPVPVVCARRHALGLDKAGPLPGDELAAAVRRLLSHLLPALRERGCWLIGHVKGLIEAGEAGQMLFSVTSFDGEPSLRMGLRGPVAECTMTLNAIVFGGDEDAVADAIAASVVHLAPWRPRS